MGELNERFKAEVSDIAKHVLVLDILSFTVSVGEESTSPSCGGERESVRD
jgi:hypothetical protein